MSLLGVEGEDLKRVASTMVNVPLCVSNCFSVSRIETWIYNGTNSMKVLLFDHKLRRENKEYSQHMSRDQEVQL